MSNAKTASLIKTAIIILAILFSSMPMTYHSETYVVAQEIAPRNVVSTDMVQSDIKIMIDRYFEGNEAKIAYAIIRAESGKNIRATNYNCYYTKDGLVHENRVSGSYSTHCKKGHENYAWSVDCSYIQRNFPGRKECPDHTFSLEWNIKEMRKLYDERGWQPWVVYNTGKYLAYMK